MQGEPTAPQPEPEPQRSEAGPAAPPPQVKHVAWSSSAPAALPTTTGSAYWEQVREQEAAWEDEMSGLLKIVKEEQPQELRDPMRAVFACRGLPPSSYMERLLRRGIAIEAAMVRVERTAHRLDDLLKQTPTSHRLHDRLALPSLSATSCGQSPQFGGTTGRRPMPLTSFSASFRTRSNPLPASWRSSGLATAASASITTTQTSRTPTPLALAVSNFEETIQRTVELHELIRFRPQQLAGADAKQVASSTGTRAPATRGPQGWRRPRSTNLTRGFV